VQEFLASVIGGERFDIVETLGSGAFGTVYEALDRQSGERVALKALTRLGPSSLLRFKQEFRALSDVHHPNLVSIKELIEQQGRWYIVMELVEGEDLLAFVRCSSDPRGFDEGRLRMAFSGMARGIEALHGHGILHRDLKPSNVRVTPEGRAVLLDFGLATKVDPAGQSTHLGPVGTVRYMAPEQITGGDLGRASDWYAFGTCLYEALLGRPPYDDANAMAVAFRKTHYEALDLSALAPHLPEDLTKLSTALVRIAPELRPSGAQVRNTLNGSQSTPPHSHQLGSLSGTSERLFAGREVELEHLERALSQSERGSLSIVLVEGESGVGKSELVAEFLRQLRARDPRTLTLRSRCYENEQVSYKAFDGCIDELAQVLKRQDSRAEALVPPGARLLAQLFPVLGDVPAIARTPHANAAADPIARRLQAFAALSALLARLADERPVVLVMDDLQWADAESFRLLRAIVEDARKPPAMLVLCTVRPRSELEPEILPHIEALRALRCVEVIPVLGLPRSHAERLATLLLGPEADDALASAIAVESRGHPLFLSELIQFSRTRDLGVGGTLSLDAAIRARVESLPAQAFALLELVALAGRPHRAGVFADALGVTRIEETVSILLGAKLMRTRRDQELSCFHDRVRHVMTSLVPKDRLAPLHRRLAEALERDFDADPTEQAFHWDLAEDPRRASHAYSRAADEASQAMAFAQAARLYERALALLGTAQGARYTALMIGRANAVACAGRSAEAAELYRQAAELAVEQEQRLRLRTKVAQQLMLSGNLHAGFETCRTLLAEVGVKLPVSGLGAIARALWDRLLLHLTGYRLSRVRRPQYEPLDRVVVLDLLNDVMKALAILKASAHLALAGQHARLALKVGEPRHAAFAYANEGWLFNALGRRKASARLFERTRELYARSNDPTVKAVLAQYEGSARTANWDFRGGSALLEQAESLYQAHAAHDPWSLTVTRYLLGMAWYRIGEHARLAQRMDLWISEARERRDHVAVALLCGMGHGSTRHSMRGAPEEALRELEEVTARVPSAPFSFTHFGHMISAQQAMTLIEPRAALAWLDLHDKRLRKSFLFAARFARQALRILRSVAALRAYEAVGKTDRRDLLTEVRKNAAHLNRQSSAFTQGFAAHFLAQVAALEGATAPAFAYAQAAGRCFAKIDYIGLHAASYLEGLLEGSATGSRKCGAALSFFRNQGWTEPERALLVMLPILPTLAKPRVVSEGSVASE
jgi:eukaryotic-like serine/threonine-protein kinase